MNEAGTGGLVLIVVAADVADRDRQHGQRARGEAGEESCGEDDADADEGELIELLEDLVVGELAEAVELGLEGFPHDVGLFWAIGYSYDKGDRFKVSPSLLI